MISSLYSLFAAECGAKGFLGLVPWYEYINDNAHFNGCDVKKFQLLGAHSYIPLVLLAVVDDLLRIAGLVAVAYVLIGATKFNNDPRGEWLRIVDIFVVHAIGFALAPFVLPCAVVATWFTGRG